MVQFIYKRKIVLVRSVYTSSGSFSRSISILYLHPTSFEQFCKSVDYTAASLCEVDSISKVVVYEHNFSILRTDIYHCIEGRKRRLKGNMPLKMTEVVERNSNGR